MITTHLVFFFFNSGTYVPTTSSGDWIIRYRRRGRR